MTQIRFYNGAFDPVTLTPNDIQFVFGSQPNPPGPWIPASGFEEIIILPGQALDLEVVWGWEGESFTALRITNYAFTL